MDQAILEEGDSLTLDFRKLKLVGAGEETLPVVVQDVTSKEVLILAYVNREALSQSLQRREVVFYSTSRQRLWFKGAESGDRLELVEARVNCEQNSLLFLVRPIPGGVCHTRDQSGATRRSCYYRRIADVDGKLSFVDGMR